MLLRSLKVCLRLEKPAINRLLKSCFHQAATYYPTRSILYVPGRLKVIEFESEWNNYFDNQ